jgi:hypothetical protein
MQYVLLCKQVSQIQLLHIRHYLKRACKGPDWTRVGMHSRTAIRFHEIHTPLTEQCCKIEEIIKQLGHCVFSYYEEK